MNVLLVEDDCQVADVFAAMLARQPGVALVECVPALAAALERTRVGGVDVILLDLGLPDSEGLEAMRRLQAEAPDVPVVVVTGSGEFELAAILAGAQDFVEKGAITGPALAQRLRIAFERHRVRGLYDPAKATAGAMRQTLDRLGSTLGETENKPDKG